MPRWQLLFTFPNFIPPAESPYTSDEDGIAICAGTDARVDQLIEGEAGERMQLLLSRFSSQSGDAYRPGCLLVRDDAHPRLLTDDTLRAFRNICAVTTTTQGWGEVMAEGRQRIVLWNDSFKFGFFTPGRREGFASLHGVAQVFESVPRMREMSFHPDSPFEGLRRLEPTVDARLLARLLVAWRMFYLESHEVYRPLFRSLEVAFQAGLFPSDGLTATSDAGTRVGSWVSAFEVLFHPGSDNKVYKSDVLAALAAGPWYDPRLTEKSFVVSVGKEVQASLVEKIYDDLHDARNAFLHGNPVSEDTLRFDRNPNKVSLVELAPILYHGALLAFLVGKVSGGPEDPQPDNMDIEARIEAYERDRGLSNVQSGLAVALRTDDEDDDETGHSGELNGY